MKTGRPELYIPSPSTISRDVKKVFVNVRKRLAKMLQEYEGHCKGTFPYRSALRPPPVSSDVYTHFTIISSFIYLLLLTFFSDISDLRRCRGTYSIPLILIPYCTIPILHDSITFSDLP